MHAISTTKQRTCSMESVSLSGVMRTTSSPVYCVSVTLSTCASKRTAARHPGRAHATTRLPLWRTACISPAAPAACVSARPLRSRSACRRSREQAASWRLRSRPRAAASRPARGGCRPVRRRRARPGKSTCNGTGDACARRERVCNDRVARAIASACMDVHAASRVPPSCAAGCCCCFVPLTRARGGCARRRACRPAPLPSGRRSA